MQTANILLALGGDRDNQIPKYNVTPAEIAVLRLIHGDESVTDVEPVGELKRSSKEERQRLNDIYARVQPNGTRKAVEVDALFPGAAARVFETFDELDLDEVFYKTETRVSAKAADPLDHDGDGKKGGTKPKAARATKAKAKAEPQEPVEEPQEQPEDETGADDNDGIGEMPDKDNLFK